MNEEAREGSAELKRIRMDDPEQLRTWSIKLGVGQAELKRIVSEVGGDPDKVRAYLNTRA